MSSTATDGAERIADQEDGRNVVWFRGGQTRGTVTVAVVGADLQVTRSADRVLSQGVTDPALRLYFDTDCL